MDNKLILFLCFSIILISVSTAELFPQPSQDVMVGFSIDGVGDGVNIFLPDEILNTSTISVNISQFWNTLSFGPLNDVNSSEFFATNNALQLNLTFLENINTGNFLRLDGTNVPTANYFWTTDLNTTGAVNPGILTVNQSLVLTHNQFGARIDNNVGAMNFRNIPSTTDIQFFLGNYSGGNDPSLLLRSGGDFIWNTEARAFPNFILINSGGIAMNVDANTNQINFSNSNFIVEADGKLTIDVDGFDLIRLGELQEAQIGYNGTDMFIDSAFGGSGRLIINRNGAGVDIGRDAVDVEFNVHGVTSFTRVNGDFVTILDENQAVVFIESDILGFPAIQLFDGVYTIILGDGLGSGSAMEISGQDISIDADGQINLDSGEDQRILRLQAFNTQTQDIMAVQDSSGNDFVVVNGSGTLEITNSQISLDATGDIITNATGNFGEIIDNGLNISSGVYTDTNKQLTSTAPTSGVLGHWNRSGTTLFPANVNDGVTVNGSTRFGANDSIIHGMNTAPVAATMLTRDYAFGTTNTASNMIFDSFASSSNTTANTQTIMHGMEFSVSGADSAIFQGKTSVGHSILVDDSSVLTNPNIHFTVATDSRVTFTGTNTANTIARMIGASYVVGGNMGTAGQAEHIGAQFTAQSTADQNTGGTFLSSGATNNIGATFTAQGAHTTNIGSIFTVTGAVNNYGWYVQSTGTKNAIGTATPLAALDISGTADDIQLLASAHSTQTNPIVLVQNSTGANITTIEDNGDVITTGYLTSIGDENFGGLRVGSGGEFELEYDAGNSLLQMDVAFGNQMRFSGDIFRYNAIADSPNAYGEYQHKASTLMRMYLDRDTDELKFVPFTESDGNLIITGIDNRNRNHDQQRTYTNTDSPRLYLFAGANVNTDNTLWMRFEHNDTDGIIETGSGDIFLNASGGDINVIGNLDVTGDVDIAGNTLALGQIFIDGDTNQIQLRVQGSPAQSADLLLVQDSSLNELFSVGTIDVNFNPGLFNIDFTIGAQGVANAFALDGATGNIIAGGPIFTIGSGVAGVDYQLFYDGETNDGFIQFLEDEDSLYTRDNLWIGSNDLLWTLDVIHNMTLVNGTGSSTDDLSQINTARVILNTTATTAIKFASPEAFYGAQFYDSDFDFEGNFMIGIHGDLLIEGSGNMGPTAIAGLWGSVTYNGTGTSIDTLMGIRGENTVWTGSGIRIADFYAATPELNGGTTNFSYGMFLEDIGNTGATQALEVWQIYSRNGDWRIGDDNSELFFGTDQDASINYDGFNFLISPKRFGGAIVIVEGAMQVNEKLTVLGNITTFDGGVLNSNSTCTFLHSPDGSTILEVCNA